jgi:hypothetical protein
LDEHIDEATVASEGVKIGEERKERLASDPEAVRKILAGSVDVEDYVTVYPSKALNKKFADFQAELERFRDRATQGSHEGAKDYEARVGSLKNELAEMEKRGDDLRAELEASAVTFHLIGIPKKAVKKIRAEVRQKYPLPPAGTPDDPDMSEIRDEEYQNRLIVAHLAQTGGFTMDEVESWRDSWSNREFGKLWASVLKLSIADDYLNGSIDPDFL